ncbi:MAG TPA: hypothetical protein VK509_23880 [Polyangiales bacterium]|nr:hypothetical protein [Polyangiales bacterium]
MACVIALWGAACDDAQPSADGGKRPERAGSSGALSGRGGRPGPSPVDAGPRDAGTDAGRKLDAGATESPRCPAGVCDLLDPLACSDDQGCVFARTDGDDDAGAEPQCSDVGTGLDGDDCARANDCSAGLDCTAFDGTGVCRRYCCALTRTEGCPSGQFCRVGVQVDMTASGVGLCDACDDCDPRDRSACGGQLACYPLSGSRECSACLPPGPGEAGTACQLSTDCVAGTACFGVSGAGSRCVAFCDLAGDGACAGEALHCRAVTGVALTAGLGLCL